MLNRFRVRGCRRNRPGHRAGRCPGVRRRCVIIWLILAAQAHSDLTVPRCAGWSKASALAFE